MKAVKIDIIQTPIDLQKVQEIYYFYKVEDRLVSPENAPPYIVAECIPIKYKLTSFHNHVNNQLTHYLVKVEDNALMNTFIQVENDMLFEYLNEVERDSRDAGYIDGIKSVKKLPFWKRLFNLFGEE